MTARDDFLARQQAHFAAADVEHFRWQTSGPGFAARERAFVREALEGAARPLLEIGCGEGANLLHLGADRDAAEDAAESPARSGGLEVGVDAFVRKLAFACSAVPHARFVCADAGALPFPDASFATVLIRDLLHHLPEPRAAVAAACRVLCPGGRFVLIEPNARNPLVRLQMALVPAERGAARSNQAWLMDLLAGQPLRDVALRAAAPLPLDRVVLHHRFGAPRLGASRGIMRALGAAERLAGKLLPLSHWSYLVVQATRAPR